MAKQTAAATFDIKNRIQEVQKTTIATIKDISQISTIIHSVNQISTVASSITQDIAMVNKASSSISESSNDAKSGADSLHALASRLNTIIKSFKV